MLLKRKLEYVTPLLQTLQRLSFSLRVEAEVLTVVYKTPYSLLPQNFPELSHSHSPPGLHCPNHTGLLTTPGLARHPSASGPLCLLFSLPRCSSPKCLRGSLAYFLKVFTQMVTLTQGFH